MPLDIYLIAIGGTGMAPLACLLKGTGHEVRGSDGVLYPPMSTLLAEAGIEPLIGYEPAHLDPRPDLVVVGNAVPRSNPEALEVEDRGIPRISMPEALARFFLEERHPLVVAGTHGKTTTTSLAAWVYSECGRDPGFLIGGVPLDLPTSFSRGSGDRFIIEGDEYNAAYFDRGPKFLHYRPHTLILTSAEYDHADLYADPETLLAAYAALIELLPPDGLLIACGDSAEVRELAGSASCGVVFYGLEKDNDLRPRGVIRTDEGAGSRFSLHDAEEGEIEVTLQMAGEHNVTNALAVWAAARHDGIPAADVAAALAGFRGVKRRMEELGTAAGVTVVDDFAHHPTAVEKTIGGLREKYPGRRLVVVFEPRSLSAARAIFFADYVRSFAGADRVYLAPIFHAARLADSERLDLVALIDALGEGGGRAFSAESTAALLERVIADLEPGDVVATMSSGSFEGLPHRILQKMVATAR